MKNILTIIAILASWISAYGQVAYEDIDIKTNNSYQYVSTYSSAAGNKYANALKWLESSINDFKNTIVVENAQGFNIVFKPEIMYEQSEAKSHYLVAVVCIDCRDDKYRIKLTDIQRKTVTANCNYLTSPNNLYKTRDYNAQTEMKHLERYKELSSKQNLTSEEAGALKNLKRYANMTKEEVVEKEMKAYTDLQKAIAKFIDGIENAIKESK